MDARPNNIVISSALALVAAVGAMAMALYSINGQDLYATGTFLGMAVGLLAFAGGMMEGTQWTWELTMVAGLVLMALALAAVVLELIASFVGILLILAVLVALVLASDEDAKYWYMYDSI